MRLPLLLLLLPPSPSPPAPIQPRRRQMPRELRGVDPTIRAVERAVRPRCRGGGWRRRAQEGCQICFGGGEEGVVFMGWGVGVGVGVGGG
jgi:hypothetical protein